VRGNLGGVQDEYECNIDWDSIILQVELGLKPDMNDYECNIDWDSIILQVDIAEKKRGAVKSDKALESVHVNHPFNLPNAAVIAQPLHPRMDAQKNADCMKEKAVDPMAMRCPVSPVNLEDKFLAYDQSERKMIHLLKQHEKENYHVDVVNRSPNKISHVKGNLALQDHGKDDDPKNNAIFDASGIKQSAVKVHGNGIQQCAAKVQQWSLDDFEIGRSLGQGAWGKVFLARYKRTQDLVALKMYDKEQLIKARIENLPQEEIKIQSVLRHRNILQLFGYFNDEKNFYLILEFSPGGDLRKKLSASGGRFSEKVAAKYISDLAQALSYCHSKQVIHRDIKPGNLLIGANGEIKIADFNLSVHSLTSRRKSGTPNYMSPEVVQKLEHDKTVDVWSLGVLVYEFLVGHPPFEAEDVAATFKRILSVDLKIPPAVSEDAQDLIRKLLKEDPKQRMPLETVPIHPWVLRSLHS